jgi:lipoprotein-releasing system permease protein
MNIAFTIARRYLFGKKSTNAINLITGISVLGIAIGTAALILILSVFNGFEDLMKTNLDKFNPEIKITLKKGKFYSSEEKWIGELGQVDGVQDFSIVIEEVALLEYGDKQQVGIIKGVDDHYIQVTGIEKAMKSGEVSFADSDFGSYSIIGSGVSSSLNVSLKNKFTPLTIYVPNRRKGVMDKDFKSRPLLVSGVFSIQNERDNQYVLSSYEMVSRLLDLEDQLSAVEIKLRPSADTEKARKEIQLLVGEAYEVQNRYQQDESFLRIMNIEKWSSYLIFAFTLLLIIFNVIGSLWMIVLDKKKDLSVLQSFGADKGLIKKIFYIEGALISLIGFGVGFLVAIAFYILQKQVGIINVPNGFAINSYPIEMKLTDVILVFFTVIVLGLLASIPASNRAARVSPYVRIE